MTERNSTHIRIQNNTKEDLDEFTDEFSLTHDEAVSVLLEEGQKWL